MDWKSRIKSTGDKDGRINGERGKKVFGHWRSLQMPGKVALPSFLSISPRVPTMAPNICSYLVITLEPETVGSAAPACERHPTISAAASPSRAVAPLMTSVLSLWRDPRETEWKAHPGSGWGGPKAVTCRRANGRPGERGFAMFAMNLPAHLFFLQPFRIQNTAAAGHCKWWVLQMFWCMN